MRIIKFETQKPTHKRRSTRVPQAFPTAWGLKRGQRRGVLIRAKLAVTESGPKQQVLPPVMDDVSTKHKLQAACVLEDLSEVVWVSGQGVARGFLFFLLCSTYKPESMHTADVRSLPVTNIGAKLTERNDE